MKKKIFLILPIIVLMIIIVIIAINSSKAEELSFNTDIKISTDDTRLTANIKALSNQSYNIDLDETVDIDSETEQKIVDTAYNMTEALNDIENKNYSENWEKYYKRPPSEKLSTGALLFTDDYKAWYDDYLTVSSVAYVLQNRNFKYEKINGYDITYTSSKRVIVQVFIDNFHGNYGITEANLDAVFEYEMIYEEISGLYKVNKLYVEWLKDLEEYYQKSDLNERTQSKNNSSAYSNISLYMPDGFTNFDYSKLKSVTSETTNRIYENNKDSIVIIDSVTEHGVTSGSASGFFIRSGVIATSYEHIYSMMNNGAARYYAVDVNEKIYEIEGIIATYPDINIAILKLKDEIGKKVTIGDFTKLEEDDPIAVISSSLGLKASMKLGIYFDYLDDDYKVIRTSLPLIDGDGGSAVFNLQGEVIAINTNVSSSTSDYNSGLNNAIDINIIKDVINDLNKEDFADINFVKFEEFNNNENQQVINQVSNSTWKKYEELPIITKYAPLELYSAYESNNYIIVRYKQSSYSDLSNENIIEIYEKYLVANSFEEIEDNIYKKDNITLRLRSNLGFIIVIVEGVK
ncbi:MAG: trypsin-like peptidase domain-containing protein [Bacilli bacterium]|nr:trypsin-like peptidase domain-containing protein [Bacilli bacterium]